MMKKTNPKAPTLLLLTLALGAGSAQAQSSVTVYGLIDQSLSYVNSGKSPLFMPPSIEAKHGMWSLKNGDPSRIGFRGQEDLGGGLTAGFQIEHRLNADSGTIDAPSTSLFWQGKSLLWLRSADFGELFMGRDNIPAFYNGAASDPFYFDSSVAALGPDLTMARYTLAGEGGFRTSNTVGYRSPRVSGVAATFTVAAGEGSSTGRQRNLGGNINYVAGPLYVGLGFDRGGLIGGAHRQLINVTASYNFGPAKLFGNMARNSNDAGTTPAMRRTTSASLGLSIPTAGGLVKMAVGRLTPDGANNDALKLGLGYEYYLSKRTMLRASVGTARTDGLDRTSGCEAGIRHLF